MNEKNMNHEEQTNTETYRYTYRACTPEQKKEAESILRQYQAPTEDALSDFERLQQIQKRIQTTLTVFGLTMGIIGCLLFGGGLSAVLLKPDILPLLIAGLVLCAVGAVVMAITYPVYKTMQKRLQSKYREQIVELCQKVLENE
jgi:hypothetical protein